MAHNVMLVAVATSLDSIPTLPELNNIRDAMLEDADLNGTERLVLTAAQFNDVDIDISVVVDEGTAVSDVEADVTDTINFYFSLGQTLGPVPRFAVDIGTDIDLSPLVFALQSISGVKRVDFPAIGDFNVIAGIARMLTRVTPNIQVVLP
jgi:hypothetical protein